MTSYNNYNTIEDCLLSLFTQLDSDYEIIIVDNYSSDGTDAILHQYQKDKRLRVYFTHCSRGLGRRYGVLLSRGEYVISQLDCDEVFKPILKDIIKMYHTAYEGFLLTMNKSSKILFFISPRSLLMNIGNYNDLNYHEDRDLYWRTYRYGKFRYFPTENLVNKHARSEFSFRHLVRIIDSSRDSFRINDFPPSLKKLTPYLPYFLTMMPVIFIISKFYKNFKNHKSIRKFTAIKS